MRATDFSPPVEFAQADLHVGRVNGDGGEITGGGCEGVEAPVRGLIRIAVNGTEHGLFIPRNFMACQHVDDAVARGFHEGFLARPEIQKRGGLFRGIQCFERSSFAVGEESSGNRHGVTHRAEDFNVNADFGVPRNGDERQCAGVREVEFQPRWIWSSEGGFAVRAGVEFYFRCRLIEMRGKNLPERGVREDVMAACRVIAIAGGAFQFIRGK